MVTNFGGFPKNNVDYQTISHIKKYVDILYIN